MIESAFSRRPNAIFQDNFVDIQMPKLDGFEVLDLIAEGKRLHAAKVPVDGAPARADFGPSANWWRRSENAAGALKRVYMELDGELKPFGSAQGRPR